MNIFLLVISIILLVIAVVAAIILIRERQKKEKQKSIGEEIDDVFRMNRKEKLRNRHTI
jgi:preprotein translocase subunit YajC